MSSGRGQRGRRRAGGSRSRGGGSGGFPPPPRWHAAESAAQSPRAPPVGIGVGMGWTHGAGRLL